MPSISSKTLYIPNNCNKVRLKNVIDAIAQNKKEIPSYKIMSHEKPQHNFWNLDQAALIFSRRCLHEALFDDKTNVQHVAADCARTQFCYRWNSISSLENRFSRV